MSKSMRNGFLILALAALVVGCGKPEEDRLVIEQIAIMDGMAVKLEVVTDKASAEKIMAEELEPYKEKMQKNFAALEALGEERREAAIARHNTELKQAGLRVKLKLDYAIKLRFPRK